MRGNWRVVLAAVAASLSVAAPATAQTIPQSSGEVAKPGGHIPASPKLALVKIADGLNDPVGISVANDGSGRVFLVERVGRVRVIESDGSCRRSRFSI